jgi:hypothetical protein
MAKQTFTTGQVLTAAQMTSLQQTAMGGGEATAKTASYVLTAADAGTTVIMNAAGATTITVNTALFAAGDTVNIQNIGAGICTVTAGTATVNTAGSLALNQYEGGVLYFRSTSAATFFDYVQTGSVSPLTTKGDLYGFSTLDARIPIGTNNQVLTADSAQALGLKWADVSGFGAYTAWTPIIDQGATTNIAQTGTQAFYAVSGEFVHAYATINLNGAGTANNQIEVSFPVAPNTGMNQSMNIGVGAILDVSPLKIYNATPTRGTASRMYFLSTNDSAFNLSYLGGVVFTAALAAGDAVYLNVHYRKA